MVALAAAAAALVAGCGTDADRDQAGAAAGRFAAALASGDGAVACAQLTPDLRSQLLKDERGTRCAAAVTQLEVHGRRVARVRVYATSAMAELADGDALFLDDTREGWRIAAVGCRPAGPGPYECEEQA